MNNKRKRKQYGLGSWLGDNASDILKTGAGAALTASGVGAPIGAGLLASGASGLAANNLVEDPNAKATIQTAGSIGGMMGGAGLLSFAMGGNTQLSEINNGGTHETNPQGGVPMGQTASVEQGETKWEDYIFSDRIKVPGTKNTFADESKKIQKKYPKERENDIPTQKAKEKEMKRLMAAQEVIRTEMGLNDDIQMANGGDLTDTTTVNSATDKRLLAYQKNPDLFMFNKVVLDSLGAPKQDVSVYGNKDAIMKSLNNSKTVSNTPSSISNDNLRWIKEPSIKGWMQSKDKAGKNIYQRTDEMGRRVGPIEYKMGGRIKAAYGLDLMDEVDTSGIRTQDIDPSLYTAGTNYVNRDNIDMDALFNNAERESAQAIANQKALNLEAQNKYNIPATGIPTITTGFSSLGKPTESIETPGVVPSVEETPVTTTSNPETNYVTGDTGLGNTKQKGSSGFDKYDAITMGAQLLPAMYNIGQGLKKQKPVDLGRMTPNLVNYDSSRKASEDSFNQQANILNEGIRENATSSGQALSNRVSFANRAALDKANQLGQINEREYNTNQQIRGNADQVNLQIRANEEMIDAQNKGISQTSIGMGLAQIGQAAGTINRDRNLRNTERETIGMMGQGSDFGIEYDEDGNPVIRFKNRKNTTPTTGKK